MRGREGRREGGRGGERERERGRERESKRHNKRQRQENSLLWCCWCVTMLQQEGSTMNQIKQEVIHATFVVALCALEIVTTIHSSQSSAQ